MMKGIIPVIFTNQFRTLKIGRLSDIYSMDVNIVSPPVSSSYFSWYSIPQGGDSGSPTFVVINNEALVLGTWYSSQTVPNISNYITEINAAMTDIDKAIATYKFEDEEEAREALARGYFANRHLGIGFDPDAEAKKLIERQQTKVAKKNEATLAEEKRKQAEATASAMAGGGGGGVSVGVPQSGEIPKIGARSLRSFEPTCTRVCAMRVAT